jgi:predicted acylesterase/phospholipase RssA
MKAPIRCAAVVRFLAVNLTLCGCTHLNRADAVPAPLTQSALTTEAADARFWPELDEGRALKIAALAASRERDSLIQEGRSTQSLPPESYLAISSGGDDGAFAAGLLVGWASRGDRPIFDVVTGVSAGALIAPFAFLGSQYDSVLRTVSSRIERRDIFHRRSLLAALTSDGMADDRPLASLIEKYINQNVLRDVAQAYAKGRLLFIGTTNLDARQLVVWDMGAIASRADAAALSLFRKIILASAAIPGVFPPVMIDVEADGKRYQEMHVDGAVMTQVFLFPLAFMAASIDKSGGDTRARRIYIIRNGRIDPQWGSTERRTTVVAHRALDALVDRQALGDIYRLQLMAQQAGSDLNIAYIDTGFNYPHRGLFAGDYMQHLFQYSYELASKGYPWCKALPGGEDSSLARIRRTIGSQLPLASIGGE